ncbi:MAG: transporter substrate-binding domain-containing protein [Desulfobacterales bacterium]|nr:transporter substrate-binding domain-containing protein [Desulfobacterales bacterium]MCP4164173.1 transporter substrate-binding domain-containing protein [Deltaproteobacteria bacterium]
MKNFVTLFICLLFPFLSSGETLKLAAGITVDPYIVHSKDSGLETDIVRESFALEGYQVKFIFQSLMRTKVSLRNGTVDGVTTIKNNYSEIQNTFLSEEYITYHNFAVTLRSRNIKINTIADLKDKNIIAFQQARFALGKKFKLMAENNPKYREMENQRLQIALFFGKRNDVIIVDSKIFNYFRQKLKDSPDKVMGKISFDEPVTFHGLFKPSKYRMAFRTIEIRDHFNMGLKKLQKSGRYKQIIESYIIK